MSRTGLLILYGIAVAIFLCLSFFFSSADMAYGSVDVLRLEKEEKNNPKKKSVARARKLASDYDRTITTVLFLNDTVNAGLDSVATLFGVNLCYLVLHNDADAALVAENWGLVASLIVLILKIAFGEIVPKSVSKINNYKLSLAYSGAIQTLIYVFFPITYPVSLLGKGISKIFSKNVPEVQVAEDDLHEMVDDIEEQGTVDAEKADMIHDTIKYTHTEAEEIMTPRVDVYAIDIDDPLDHILEDPKLFKYSRIPVYKDTIDNVVGYVMAKDLMIKLVNHENFKIQDLLLEPLRFPQSAEINDILRTFKKTKKHFALVIDEYGGLDGIITMEDVLEEIVGEIWDEKDRPQDPIVPLKDGAYILDGNITLEDFCDLFDIDFEKIDTEYLTLGGFVIELLDDRFAKVGDTMEFEGVKMKVLSIDDNGAVERIWAKKEEKAEKD